MSDDSQFYVQGVLKCDRRVVAKTITLIESSLSAHQDLAHTIIDLLLPYAGKAIRLGITGAPGVGKSTFIESLGTMLVKKGHRVAVLAVDPSSKRSGGSVLADKTRMEKLAVEERAFVRPSPSGGTLGGVARKTRETMILCEAAGFDVIIVETVGVGQSETAVASMVDFFLMLIISGAGDELQGIKKGILELADAVVVNKADGDNVERAEFARKQYETALHFLSPSSPNWRPPVLTCSAMEMIAIDVIWETVLKHHRKFTQTGELEANRKRQAVDWMWSLVKEGYRKRFYQNPEVGKLLPEILKEVESGKTASTLAASRLLHLLENKAFK
ncbi:MAG: methylmalonyl Co-A mutase-associated GTPase MeaB [Deltaproteobacteria bacterium]|nr:methylmalonyl Co-A mutase-associated GTPase MeaB [Deltaproteobacteria bacterium]